ncbi:MAG: hypothetical protein RID53_29750 [Coleofasciculus sp. B1-GNL1-01]|uniref:hypothetical protein n=1 Tax=Coleofasciculus sp. B1-GNL1-01 TaxID=3068484 RepID=UPI003300CFE8
MSNINQFLTNKVAITGSKTTVFARPIQEEKAKELSDQQLETVAGGLFFWWYK